ncbi:hypothetical protein F2Q69_00037652 [Brassica cretica]|uniref:Uncharacterized protein n=1 Tax=Brassica cretica TaxID=69181 RepID=A0A8S9SGF7_BRACR|nr:hypothetical protein F2Q69_00037652 [Brassica cretica]
MRALKKSRAAKAASAASYLGNVLATLLTVIFFFALVLQNYFGFRPPKLLGRHCTGKANGGFVSVQYAGTPSASEPNGGYTGPGLAQRLPKYVVSNWLRRAELNAIFSKPLRELLSTESEVDDAALISIDSKGIDVRVRQGAQEGHGVETLEEAKAALWKVMEKVKLNYLQK